MKCANNKAWHITSTQKWSVYLYIFFCHFFQKEASFTPNYNFHTHKKMSSNEVS